MTRYLQRLYGGLWGVGRQPWLWLLLWTVGLLWIQPSHTSLMPDEGYYVQQARWILANHDWVTVGWWGEPRFDRPIGINWLIALSYQAFGVSEGAARLPSRLLSLGAVLLTWRMGTRLAPPGTGLWGAAILAVMPLWMQASTRATQDIPLIFLELLAVWGLLQAEDHPQRGWRVLAGMALGLGLIVNGLVVFLPLVALFPYLVHRRHTHRHLSSPGLYYGLALGALPALVWLGCSMAQYGGFPLSQLLGQILIPPEIWRADPAAPFNPASSMTSALWQIPIMIVPWGLFALVGVGLLWRDSTVGRRALWVGYPVVLGLLIQGFTPGTGDDLLPLYPFVALLAALGLQYLGRWYRSRSPRRYRVAVALSWVIGTVGLLLFSAGVALLLAPDALLVPELRPYGWLGLLGGLGWLLPWVLAMGRHSPVSRWQQGLWQGGWLLGPWLALAATLGTGIWGNYSPSLKATLTTPPVTEVLAQGPVHMVQPEADQDAILITFYSPQLGLALGHWGDIPPSEYAWGNATLRPVPTDTGYTTIATLGTWHLVQAPQASAVPPG